MQKSICQHSFEDQSEMISMIKKIGNKFSYYVYSKRPKSERSDFGRLTSCSVAIIVRFSKSNKNLFVLSHRTSEIRTNLFQTCLEQVCLVIRRLGPTEQF